MKKIIFAAALASLAGILYADQALGADGAYVSLRGGVGLMADQDDDNNYGLTKSSDVGTAFMGALGRQVGDARIEAEVGYLSNNIQSVQAEGFVLPGTTTGTTTAIPIMLAGFYDFRNMGSETFVPYVGAGLGAVHIHENIESDELGLTEKGTNFVFGYTFMAGFNAALNQSFSAGLGYQFLGTTEGSYNLFNSAGASIPYNDNYYNNLIMANLTYKFS